MMNENYWKNAYEGTWGESSAREEKLRVYLEKMTQRKIENNGLGAGSSAYIPGSAARNGYQKGDADLVVSGTNIYVEVTGPLKASVSADKPLWFRPDKIENAIKNPDHDVFFAHHCVAADLWRIIHVDSAFKERFRNRKFPVVTPYIGGRKERYIEVKADDPCIHDLRYLVEYIKNDR